MIRKLLHEYLAEQLTVVETAKADVADVPTEISDLVTPQPHIANATEDLADLTTKFNTLLAQLEALGFLQGE